MPFCTTVEQSVLNAFLNLGTWTVPATQYVGVLVVPNGSWPGPSVSVSLNEYAVGSAFTTTNRHIYKATTGGTSGSTEPSWNQGAGATTTDGSVVWTEVSNLFASGAFTGSEPSGGNYSRVAVSANTTNWPNATGGNPASSTNGTAFTFPESSTAWGYVCGILFSSAASGGTYQAWGLTSQLLNVGSANITPQLPIASTTVTVT